MNYLKTLGTKKTLDILGLMSGTSADGLDLAWCRLSENSRKYGIKTLATGFGKFPPALRDWILQIAASPKIEKLAVKKLDLTLSVFYVSEIKKFIKKNKITKIDLIASHGQTIQHQDGRGSGSGQNFSSTWQLGDGAYISTLTKIPVVSDFRGDDIAAGGSGAPLTPLCHYHLLGQAKQTIAVLNIGGITNLTGLPASGKQQDIVASDCGPGNMLIDQLMQKYYDKRYDNKGRIALLGSVNRTLLNNLLKSAWHKKPFPKSLGREQFGSSLTEKITKFATKQKISYEDIIATVSELTIQAVVSYLEKLPITSELLVCGGGAHNRYFMNRLAELLPGCKIKSTAKYGLDPDYIEAVCFALLGFMYVKGRPSGLRSVTGAKTETVLGKLSLP